MHDLSDAERERLEMLIEECSEVIQIAAKTLRHGYDSYNPNTGEYNGFLLNAEVNQVKAIINKMDEEGDIESESTSEGLETIWRKKLHYTHHQEAAL